MEKGNIKITLECMTTNNSVIIEFDADKKTANIDLDNLEIDKASPVFEKTFVEIVEFLGLKNQLFKGLEDIANSLPE